LYPNPSFEGGKTKFNGKKTFMRRVHYFWVQGYQAKSNKIRAKSYLRKRAPYGITLKQQLSIYFQE